MRSPAVSAIPESSDPLRILEEVAQSLFVSRYPPGNEFRAVSWSTNPGKKRRERGTNNTVLFEGLKPQRAVWSPRFTAGVKVFLVLEDLSLEAAAWSINALRNLGEAIERRHAGGVSGFDWPQLRLATLEETMAVMRERGLAEDTCYAYACLIHRFVSWLEDNLIIQPIGWSVPLRNPTSVVMSTHRGRERRLNRLPTRAAVIGLAAIYAVHAKRPADRLVICALGIAMVTGLRADELLTLPVDCLFKEVGPDGKSRYGIRFFNKKARGKKEKFATRWLSPLAAELAIQLVQEIAHLTQKARARARQLEENPRHFPLQEKFRNREWLTLTEATNEVVGATINIGIYHRIREIAVKAPRGAGRGVKNVVPRRALEQLCLEERLPLLVDLGHGVHLKMSEMLLVIPFNFVGSGIGDDSRKYRVRHLFVQILSYQQLAEFISGRNQSAVNKPRPSAFERFGITEPDGSGGTRFCRLRSHMLRHWLSTLANRSGMSAFQITLWMQRTRKQHTGAYLHEYLYDYSATETAEFVVEKTLDGRIWGQKTEEMEELAEEERRTFLERVIRQAQVMEGGVCSRELLIDNCEDEKLCPPCQDYHHAIGDEREQAYLLRVRSGALQQVVRIHRHREAGVNVHPRQLQIAFETVVAVDDALAAGG
jgi:hypothetical protein